MRIVDILKLRDGDDDDEDEIGLSDSKRAMSELPVSPSPPSPAAESCLISSSSNDTSVSTADSSPRSLFSRWLRPLRKPAINERDGSLLRSIWNRRKKGKEEGCGFGQVVGPTVPVMLPPARGGGLTGAEVEDSRSNGGEMLFALQGKKLDHVSFNLGLGTGLALLLARSASEFNKIREMQRQMEIMLKEIKDVIQSKDSIHDFSDSNNRIAISASDCYDDSNTSKMFSLQRTSLDGEERKYTLKYEEHSNCDTNLVKRSPKMDELEAELEIELERLQLNLKKEGTPMASGAYGTKMTAEDTDSSGSFSIRFGEDNDQNEDQHESCGVSAHELERRLHELLETRQEEQIAELESVLECTKSKLHEKEIEASQWREMASRALHQLEGRLLR